MTAIERFNQWSGHDDSPGGMTWREWELRGVSRDALENVAPTMECAGRFSELDDDDYFLAMDRLWADRARVLLQA